MPKEQETLNSGSEAAQETPSISTTQKETQQTDDSSSSKGKTVAEQADDIAANILRKGQEAQPDKQEEGEQKSGEEEEPSEQSESSSQREEGEEQEKGENEDQDKTDETKDAKEEGEDKLPPFHKHPRWIEVQEQLKEAKPLVEKQRHLQGYREKFGISEEQFSQAMELLALVNVDPEGALKRMGEFTGQIETRIGTKLPADLQKAVDDGEMSQEWAEKVAKQKVAVETERQQRQRQVQESARQAQSSIGEAVNAWEKATQKHDPTFQENSEVYNLVLDRITRMFGQTPPRSPQHAVEMTQRAYEDITGTISKLGPRPAAKKILTTNGSSTKTTVAPKPKTADDVARRVFERARRG